MWGGVTSFIFLGFLHSVSAVFDTSILQLVPSIRSHKQWCQARALLSLYLKPSRHQHLNLFDIFLATRQHLGSSLHSHLIKITLNPANKKADQSLRISDWHCWLKPLLIQCSQFLTWVALVDTISSLKDSEGGTTPVSECLSYLPRFMTFYTNTPFKCVGNTAHILVHVFNFAARQHHEVWPSQFSFLYSLRDMVPPTEACLNGYINWSLAKAQQQSFMCLSQSFPPMRGGKARPKTGFHFNVQETCVKSLVVPHW